MNIGNLEAGMEMYQDAQMAVQKAQADLRNARWSFVEEILRAIPPQQAIDMGIFSLNIGAVRRVIRMSRR